MSPVYDLSTGILINSNPDEEIKKPKTPKKIRLFGILDLSPQSRNRNGQGNPHPYHSKGDGDERGYNDENSGMGASYVESYVDSGGSETSSAEEAHIRQIAKLNQNQKALNELNVKNVEFAADQSCAMSEINSSFLSDDDCEDSVNNSSTQVGGTAKGSDLIDDSSTSDLGVDLYLSGEVRDANNKKAYDYNNNINNEEQIFRLQRDVFTFIFVSPIFSLGSIYAIIIFTIQLFILILAMTGLLKDPDKGNSLHIPLYVENDVKIAQFLALLVSVFTAKDIIHSLDVFQIEYDESVKELFPSATYPKWILSNFLRFCEGILSVIVTFLFIVQSVDVLDLFLDFAVVKFVGELDELGFHLAEKGYSIVDLTILVNKLKPIQFKFARHTTLVGTTKQVRSSLIQKMIFCVTLVVSVFGWMMIQIDQARGHYYSSVCQTFEVKFDDFTIDYFRDTCNVSLACPSSWIGRNEPIRYVSFNDVYEAERDPDGSVVLYNHRPVYHQRGLIGMDAFGKESPPGKFFYCEEEEAWVFTIEGINKGIDDGGCNWLMKSLSNIESHSLHEVDRDGWIMWTGVLNVANDFSISCVECNGDGNKIDVGCTYHGKCVNEKCMCETNWMGVQCETCVSCSELSLYNSTSTTLNRYRRFDVLDTKTDMVKPLEVYGRPVYYRIDIFGNIDPNLEAIIYAGRRYVIGSLKGKNQNHLGNEEDLETFLRSFHSTWDFDPDAIIFASELTHAPMPFGLKWTYGYDMIDDDDIFFHLDLICPDENERNECRFMFNDF